MNIGNSVLVKTGKYKGKKGTFCGWTIKHPLSSSKRGQIRLQTGNGFVTLLVNEENFDL